MVIQPQSLLGERRSPQKEGLRPAVEFAVTSSVLRPAALCLKRSASVGCGRAGGFSTHPARSIVTSFPIRRSPARVARLTRQEPIQAPSQRGGLSVGGRFCGERKSVLARPARLV